MEKTRGREHFESLYKKNLELTKKQVKESVNEDSFIAHAIGNVGELDKAINLLSKRLREWYALYNPEMERETGEHEKLVQAVLENKGKREKNSMGAEISSGDLSQIMLLAGQIKELYDLRKKHESYLEEIMKKHCPNMLEVAGVLISAKLLEHAGSLRRLMMMPASTIQILGAEKALFRHLKTGKKAKPPKYGILSQHPLIGKVKKEEYGKVARTLADKISIAVKVDYFKGKFIGDKLKEELEKKFQ
ncbi:hypothetical protein J4458_01645 [Candidatus Woesearchaeota archaeon]|nr:hypothetical protein [Candidatus Woesearchaeota archaeon]